MKQIKKFLQYTSGTCTMSKLSGKKKKKKKNHYFFRFHHNLGFCAIWGSTKLRHARLEA